MTIRRSYEKVPYDLRPAKQVERRMIVDALQKLARSGMTISEYQYTGFGSIFFVDFILFHKLLGLRNMLSIEKSPDEKRVQFNRPFRESIVDIKSGEVSEHIPSLSPKIQHIVWLDYDYHLNKDMLEDVTAAVTQLSVGSVLIITVDIQLDKDPEKPFDTKEKRFFYYKEESGKLFKETWSRNDFSSENIANVNAELLYNAIRKGLTGRDLAFHQMYKFIYADGHEMLTIGGMIGGDKEKRILNMFLKNTFYIRRKFNDQPYKIHVPILTRKEKLTLDAAMPCADAWKPDEFELKDVDVKAYREIYRFYPAYAELLL